MTKDDFSSQLVNYVPKGSEKLLTDWIFDLKIALTITRNRKTKLGDFRTYNHNSQLKISVNGNLNPYSFLITLVHEIAHALVFKEYGHKTKPHGVEWKYQYKKLMINFFARNVFPDDITRPLAAYMKNPKASSQGDSRLLKALRNYDTDQENILCLEDLNEGEVFSLNGRVFQKGLKRRSRYNCIEINSKREFAVSGMAEVELIKQLS